MSGILEALSCTGRNPLSLWTTQGSVSRIYDNTSRCYVLNISNDQRRSSIERSFGPFYRFALVQVRPQADREFSIDLSVEAPHSRRLRLCISTAFRLPSVNDVHVQVPLGRSSLAEHKGWLSLLIDSEFLVNSAFSGKFRPQGISSIRVNGCCAVRKVLLLREPVQVDRDFAGLADIPHPIHPAHEFPPGVKRLAVRLGYGSNRLDLSPNCHPVSLVTPSRVATPRIVGNHIPTLPLGSVSAAGARRSSALAVENIKLTARLLFDQIADHPMSCRGVLSARGSPQIAASLPARLASPQVAASVPRTQARSAVSEFRSPRPKSVRGEINAAFNELREMRKVSSQPPTPGTMLLKVGELLYDPENDRHPNTAEAAVRASSEFAVGLRAERDAADVARFTRTHLAWHGEFRGPTNSWRRGITGYTGHCPQWLKDKHLMLLKPELGKIFPPFFPK